MAFNIDNLLNRHDANQSEENGERSPPGNQLDELTVSSLVQQTLLMRASILANTAVNDSAQPSLGELQMLLGFGGSAFA